MYSHAMNALPPIYRCRQCGATSYRKLTHRGSDGVMRYSGIYRCSGCSFTFSEPADWRERRLRARETESRQPTDNDPAHGAFA